MARNRRRARLIVVTGAVLVPAGALLAYGLIIGNGIPIWLGAGLLACGLGVLALSALSERPLD